MYWRRVSGSFCNYGARYLHSFCLLRRTHGTRSANATMVYLSLRSLSHEIWHCSLLAIPVNFFLLPNGDRIHGSSTVSSFTKLQRISVNGVMLSGVGMKQPFLLFLIQLRWRYGFAREDIIPSYGTSLFIGSQRPTLKKNKTFLLPLFLL